MLYSAPFKTGVFACLWNGLKDGRHMACSVAAADGSLEGLCVFKWIEMLEHDTKAIRLLAQTLHVCRWAPSSDTRLSKVAPMGESGAGGSSCE